MVTFYSSFADNKNLTTIPKNELYLDELIFNPNQNGKYWNQFPLNPKKGTVGCFGTKDGEDLFVVVGFTKGDIDCIFPRMRFEDGRIKMGVDALKEKSQRDYCDYYPRKFQEVETESYSIIRVGVNRGFSSYLRFISKKEVNELDRRD